jgi:hypothetical protein
MHYGQSKESIIVIRPKELRNGDIVDVKDGAGVWNIAEIKLVITYPKYPIIYMIHYIDWNTECDEYIPDSSARITVGGFVTSRAGIPHYITKRKELVNSTTIIRSDKLKDLMEMLSNHKMLQDSNEDNPNRKIGDREVLAMLYEGKPIL